MLHSSIPTRRSKMPTLRGPAEQHEGVDEQHPADVEQTNVSHYNLLTHLTQKPREGQAHLDGVESTVP